LHARLRSEAGHSGLSLNEYCLRRLAAAEAWRDRQDVAAVVGHAVEVAGPALVGVVAFGSWARGQAADGSDVDLLVIVDAAFELTRAVYARWDERPLAIEGRSIDAHFVQLPEADARPSGLWAEVAIDGIVIVERKRVVSSWLSAVRRALVDGKLARRLVHGQPYWCEVA
jgi:predicted nucleotidyltransferase